MHRWRTGKRWGGLGAGLLAAVLGCGPKDTRLDLQTFNAEGASADHYADFGQASYFLNTDGHLELLLESQRPSTVDPTQTIRQWVYMRTFWNPRPGTTFAEATQINTRVVYAMLSPPTGIRYDGSAFVSFRRHARTGRLEGKLESGILLPRYTMGDAQSPFHSARVTGTFVAEEQPRRVVDAARQLQAMFSAPLQ